LSPGAQLTPAQQTGIETIARIQNQEDQMEDGINKKYNYFETNYYNDGK